MHILFKKIFQVSFFINILLLFASYYSTYVHPQSFVLLPLLSLMFPVLLFLMFLWIIFFAIFFQFEKLIIAIASLLFFFPQIKEYYNISFSELPSHPQNTFSIMSFNVKLFDLYNWQNNHLTRQKIFDYLQKHPADIMCFQEFYTSEDANDFNNLDELKKMFKDYYFHVQYFVTLRKNDHWGLLTMSKFPIANAGVLNFNNAKNNGCIFSDIVIGKDTIRVFNLHLQSFNLYKKKKWKPNQKPDNETFFEALDSTARGKNFIGKIYYNTIIKIQQIESIIEIINHTPYPVLIIGDFNEISNSYLVRLLKKNNFKDAFVQKGNGFGITFYDKIYVRIDYIFCDNKFRVLNFNTENNSETKHISDHYPIRSMLELIKK